MITRLWHGCFFSFCEASLLPTHIAQETLFLEMAGKDIPLYPYTPSKIAAIACVIVFATITAIHVYKLFKTKTWFCIPFIIGLICKPISDITKSQYLN